MHIGVAALASYRIVIGMGMMPAPDDMDEQGWQDLVAAGALVLERLVEDVLALASR